MTEEKEGKPRLRSFLKAAQIVTLEIPRLPEHENKDEPTDHFKGMGQRKGWRLTCCPAWIWIIDDGLSIVYLFIPLGYHSHDKIKH